MRLSSQKLSDSPSPPPATRRRRRRQPPSSDASSPSPSYTQPTDTNSAAAADPDAASDANSGIASYSSISTTTQTPPPYINVAPLPIFLGAPTDCPVAHLARFDRVCRANNATTTSLISRIFPVTLDADAALWYDLTIEPRSRSLSWPDTRSEFVSAFRRPDFAERSRAELMAMRQGEEERVNAYHVRMQWVLKKWPENGIPDAVLRSVFVGGLREDFQDWIVPQRPETMEEAVGMAMGWEERAAARRRCGFCDGGGHGEEGCDVRRKMKEAWLKSKEEVGGGGGVEDEGGGVGRAVSMRRRTQCQCWKHQCWKKLERSSSAVTDVNPTTINNAE